MDARDILSTFDTDHLPDLDVAVDGALLMLDDVLLPETAVPFKHPLVVGSGNAEHVGRIIFRDKDAVFANESNFKRALDQHSLIDGVVIISASGSKHSVPIAEHLRELSLPTMLFTNTMGSPAAAFVGEENTRVFPKNREPYTYNTSTYFSMVAANTREEVGPIKRQLDAYLRGAPDFSRFTSFTFILPANIFQIAPMLRTKFDELFGTRLNARFYTPEEIKHAKTVVPNDAELFISFTPEGDAWGQGGGRFAVPMSKGDGFLDALALTYHLIGQIQKAHPPYFKENIVRYCDETSRIFGTEIKPIVE